MAVSLSRDTQPLPDSQDSPQPDNVAGSDDLLYDACNVDWATIAAETEAALAAGQRLHSLEEFMTNLERMDHMTVEEQDAFLDQLCAS